MNNIIRVCIADDHDLYRDGLHLLLNKDREIEVTGEAANGRELIELALRSRPDVILTDLIMPGVDGVTAIRELREKGFDRIIALSTFDSERLIVEALEAGAQGYVIKNAQKGEIMEAIRKVNKYQPYYCSSTSIRLARHIGRSTFNPYNRDNKVRFDDREKEIIRLICEERSNEDIGKTIYMSKRTVEGIRARILKKMNVRTPAGVAIYAIKHNIYVLDDKGMLPA